MNNPETEKKNTDLPTATPEQIAKFLEDEAESEVKPEVLENLIEDDKKETKK